MENTSPFECEELDDYQRFYDKTSSQILRVMERELGNKRKPSSPFAFYNFTASKELFIRDAIRYEIWKNWI